MMGRTMKLGMTSITGEWIEIEVPMDEYAEGVAHGKQDKVGTHGNPTRPIGKKTYRCVPEHTVRKVIPASRPKDAGPCLRHRWERAVETFKDKAYADGYRAGKAQTPASPSIGKLDSASKASVENLTRKAKGSVKGDLAGWAQQERCECSPFEHPSDGTYKTY